MSVTPETTARQRNTVRWVVLIAALALIFDGYDLVVYGTVVSDLLRDPSQLGPLDAAQAGALGSYALVGVMVGALVAGAVGDYLGRRKVMLVNIAAFSIGMALTSMATSVFAFGILRFLTGLGVGALVATAGAVVAEFAPAGRKNFYNAIVYSGVPAGALMASLLAIIFNGVLDWRGLFMIGALPIVFLLPLAVVKLPESPRWLQARGRLEEAELLSRRTGIPLALPAAPAGTATWGTALPGAPASEPAMRGTAMTGTTARAGFAGLATRTYGVPTAFLGIMSFSGLLLTYGLNTWLPEIMGQYGYEENYSLLFLVTLNAGAVIGGLLASRSADKFGAKRIVSTTFGLAALSLCLLTFGFPLPVLLAAVAIAGVGTLGTQVLIYGLVSNYYQTSVRAAGVAWCAGFGRLGGIVGPLLGGFLLAGGVRSQTAFYIFAGIALAGALVTMFLPPRPETGEPSGLDATKEPVLAGTDTLEHHD
ncbi:MFS family benzoate membrane transporter [Arthrobacter crystallopoietes BAB-32]|uniref:MFS family benzoate membrane transporter n=1 Tax=Arthrobacter crystallopoietes BAB-32 TaxID=1246476 RepID=N1UX48_9MICC|nr:aromatic acid/H+ symport family MFS transporter [Arthrobacter crystallopoietes]EMY32407.1 MFS family benzoate membrane transporter [Arthrobacter crystallopoietes BAB-32]